MRRTKIVASLGPSTDEPAVMQELVDAGIDIARINLSHGSHDDHRRRARELHACAENRGRAVGLLLDLQGPKIRVECFQKGPVTLENGAIFVIDSEHPAQSGTAKRVGTSYPHLSRDLELGDSLLLDDGNVVLTVEELSDTSVTARVEEGGVLSDHKGINRRGGGLTARALTDKDRLDVQLAAEIGADYVGVSFVRDADDLDTARRWLREAGCEAHLVAKIERVEALDNIDAIIGASDVIMVARGDLGVEIGDAELPGVQKRLIATAQKANKVVITATQMMQSMVSSLQPTRAEVLDVANAVLDGTDAVMLSAETAVGQHPPRVVEAMNRICRGAEQHAGVSTPRERGDARFDDTDEAIAMAAMYTANHYDVSGILAMTESGSTAKWMSRITSAIPIFAMTRWPATERRTALYRGVYPVSFDPTSMGADSINQQAMTKLKQAGMVTQGDRLVVTQGDWSGISGRTNSMKIITVGDINGKEINKD
ncbi:MAG: pyruvate kinase [Pseudomonadota bacterium]|nr:pyruvate kinase [Pseudomonadota bacterium]